MLILVMVGVKNQVSSVFPPLIIIRQVIGAEKTNEAPFGPLTVVKHVAEARSLLLLLSQ